MTAITTDAVVADVATHVPGRRARAWGSTAYDQGKSAVAVFGNATWKLSRQFNVTGGLRWNRAKKDIHLVDRTATSPVSFSDPSTWWRDASLGAPSVTNYDQKDRDAWEELTYDLTQQYRFNDHASAYFRFAHGFRAGGFAVSGAKTITAPSKCWSLPKSAAARNRWRSCKMPVTGGSRAQSLK